MAARTSMAKKPGTQATLRKKEENNGTEVCEALKDNFLGFQSNRFGRISHLSTIVLKHISLLRKFFDENVDENKAIIWLTISAIKPIYPII